MKTKAKSSLTSPSKSGKGHKGKGKGASSANDNSGSTMDLGDVPLSLPDFADAKDHEQWVPRYHAVLCRSESDGVMMEDVDALQLELEAMLAATVVKKRTVAHEVKIIEEMERRGGSSSSKSGGKRGAAGGPASPAKRGANNGSSSSASASVSDRVGPNKDSAKRFRNAAGKPVDSGKVIGIPKIKSDPSSALPHFDPLQNEQIQRVAEPPPKPNLPKNETPNRFWSFVEPYCAPITPEDIKLLEDLIKGHGDMNEYYRIPPLGQHYTQRWAKEDIENERQKGAGAGATSEGNGDSKVDVKKEAAEEQTPHGELTQRLVAGLIEENLMTSVEESIDAHKAKNAGSDDADKTNLIKSLNVSNADALESRVRRELEEQGILDANDGGGESAVVENDEILEEMRRCQNELKAVSAHNLGQLRRLLKAAKEEMVRQELRNKLARADAEVMEAYQKVSAARSKKRAPTKKERELAWKALKEREIILRELESV